MRSGGDSGHFGERCRRWRSWRRFGALELVLGAACLLVLAPDEADGYAAQRLPPKSIMCSGHDTLRVRTFRRVQEEVLRIGIANVFDTWDGIDDSVPEGVLSWKEMRMGLTTLVIYDPYGQEVVLETLDREFIIREIGDDDTVAFQKSEWGTSFEDLDANLPATVKRWEDGRPRNTMDGGNDNAYCFTPKGAHIAGACDAVPFERFEAAINMTADTKYGQNCNGHGRCDFSIGLCLCDEGWNGFNCSEPEKPCSGIQYVRENYGSVSDGYGYGLDRNYSPNLNCTWILQPDIITSEYGLPIVITFMSFQTESTYDPVVFFLTPYVSLDTQVATYDGVYPRFSDYRGYGMPQLVVVLADNGIAVNFISDPTTTDTGFRFMFGFLERNYIEGVKNPMLAPGCTRHFETESPECEDTECTNCGVTTTEADDEAVTSGDIDNMCYVSQQHANQTYPAQGATYRPCGEVVYRHLQVTAGTEVLMRTPCPRGMPYTALPTDRTLDKPEFMLGPGLPQISEARPQEGQAYQKGFVTTDWWAGCTAQCDIYRRDQQHDKVYPDELGSGGPILAARLYARNSTRASRLQTDLVTYPMARASTVLYGYPSTMADPRSQIEKNSRYLLDAYGAVLTRCTSETKGDPCDLNNEQCDLRFTPTIPGFYEAEFFNLRKLVPLNEEPTYMEAIPFPIPNHLRAVIVVPGPTSAAHCLAHGPGMNYAKSARAGSTSYFHIDTYDELLNARLSGGDQWNVALVHQELGESFFADVSNMGNGTYVVLYNLTLNGRYDMHITLKHSNTQPCQTPTAVPLGNQGSLNNGELRCHMGAQRTAQIESLRGNTWCPPGSAASLCSTYTFANQKGLAPIPPMSPYSIFVDSGPTAVDSVQAYGMGLSHAIAGFSAFFMLRIQDAFGNFASQDENVTVAFELPEVYQSRKRNSTSPATALAIFAGDELWQGDYAVEWMPVLAGPHNLSVMFCRPACEHIVGSPFKVKVLAAPTYGPNSTVQGSGIKNGTAGDLRHLLIRDRGSAVNPRTVGGERFDMTLSGLSLGSCPIIHEAVIEDVSCKCQDMYRSNMTQCRLRLLQDQPGADLSINIPPALTCAYRRNIAACDDGCCPNGEEVGCSEFSMPSTHGMSAQESKCIVRQCAKPPQCKVDMKVAQQQGYVIGDLFESFLQTSMKECAQLERVGLEAQILLPKDPGVAFYNQFVGPYGLIRANLNPLRESWKGLVIDSEVYMFIESLPTNPTIKSNSLQELYYSRETNSIGQLYFQAYSDATGPRHAIEGFVQELADTRGNTSSRTSQGVASSPTDPSQATRVGNFSSMDHDDGTYSVFYNITRAGLYSLSVAHQGLQLFQAPYEFIVSPQKFHPKSCVINGTGASKNKNPNTEASDYKGAIVSGKFVFFDIALRDMFDNYIWRSLPETLFRISLDPMRVRYFDTGIRFEQTNYWPAHFLSYAFHDFGDANYRVDYSITTAGTFPLNIRLKNEAAELMHLDRSPFMISVRPDKVDLKSSTAFGQGLTSCGAGLICTFAVELRDKFGNRRVFDNDEGPYCHTWNANVNNGGSDGNNYRKVFPDEGCSAGDSCGSVWSRWANTRPASGTVVDGPEEAIALPALNNEVAYNARGGVLHDCVPMAPFATEAEYSLKPSCVSTRLGPCGQYDEYGRVDVSFYKAPPNYAPPGVFTEGFTDTANYTWLGYRDTYPLLRPHLRGMIQFAEPAQYQNFNLYIDEDNLYSASFNLTLAGTFRFDILATDEFTGETTSIRGSPFTLRVTGGLTAPADCRVDGVGLHQALIGYPTTFSVLARDRFSNTRTLGREKVEVFIQGTPLVNAMPAMVHDRLDGSYYVEYNATVTGRYSLTITILDQAIAGSPFLIDVHRGINFPHFNNSWGLIFAGSAGLVPLQGPPSCFMGDSGCVSALRLTANDGDAVGAVWYNTKIKVDFGFEAEWSFMMDKPSRHCKSTVVFEDRCMPRGGDGLAFVIHDNGFPGALGAGGAHMGYGGIDNSLAIEFDTWFNAEQGDIYQNHLAVHTMGTEQNSPGAQARLASSTDIPDIPDGNRHTVRVRYQPWMDAETVSDPSYKASPYSAQWLHGGGGVLIIWVDDLTRPVLSVPVNLTSTLSLDAGMAFVGFTAATGAALQNHYIYSWSITESTCQLDCSNRGDCVQGVCHCIDPFYGATCALSPITQDFSSRHLCPILLPDTPLASAPKPDPDCLCAPGFTGPEGGPCFACPVDTWKFTKGPDVCIPCPPNSDSQRKYGVKTRDDCVCKAGYTGTNGGPCHGVPEDSYKISPGAYPSSTVQCPANSGTFYRRGASNVIDCMCKPGYQGPNGGPCLVCPTESYKGGWGNAACESICPPNSETFGCDGPGNNTGCTSFYQCVCKEGFTGTNCVAGSPQLRGGRTCAPCVRTDAGPTKPDWVLRSPFYDPKRPPVYTDGFGGDSRDEPV